MMKLLKNKDYLKDVQTIADLDLDWEKLANKTVLISGASGMIGTFLIDVFMAKENIRVLAMGRNEEKAKERFSSYWNSKNFRFIRHDINQPFACEENIHYIIHLASNTHPLAYSNDPIGTITTNVLGTYHLLELACNKSIERFVLASSVEVYGENRHDCDKFKEDYCGYIDCNTLRAGYPESKRVSEAMCQAYMKQKNLDVVIPRLSRVYGPTMLMSDSKALSQFIKKGIHGEDIVLKSEGTQFYSYSYVADAVSGMLYVMLCGKKGEAYNIADSNSDITLKDLAKMIADINGKRVIFEIPDDNEKAGYSTATKAILDSSKIKSIGWKSLYPINIGIERTISILKEII